TKRGCGRVATAAELASAADLKFLTICSNSVRNFKSKSGTRIIELRVPLCFRSSCQSVLRCITNFGNGALGLSPTHGRIDCGIGELGVARSDTKDATLWCFLRSRQIIWSQ